MLDTDIFSIVLLSISYLTLGAACSTMLSHTQSVKHSRFRNYFITIGFFCWPLSILLIIAYGFYYPFEVLYKLLKGNKDASNL